jgi:hypothetical protein
LGSVSESLVFPQIKRLLLDAWDRPVGLRAIHRVFRARIQHGEANAGGLFPPVFYAFKIVIEKLAEVLHVLRLVIVRPFTGIVNTKPAFFA